MSDLFSNVSDTSYTSDIDDIHNSLALDLDNGSPIDTNKFIIVQYNIYSILCDGRIEELIETCNILKVSVLVITESWLDETITNNSIAIPGFHEPIRRDRTVNGKSTRSGGCLIYISELLSYDHKSQLQENLFEHIWVDIRVNNIKLSINCIYRPPNNSSQDHESFLETSENILKKLDTYDTDYKILTSDLNFGNIYCKTPILPPKPLYRTAPDLYAKYGYLQLIDIPTRITKDTTSLIDLFYIQNDELIVCHGTLPNISDHSGIFVSLDIKREKKKPTTQIVYDYKNANVEELLSFIKNYNFEQILSSPIQNQAQQYSDVIISAFDQFIPKKTIIIRSSAPPWSNTYTRLLIRKKNRNYNFFRRTVKVLEKAKNENDTHETITKLTNKKDKSHRNYKIASRESLKATRRVKQDYFNSVNCVMNNPHISAKKKFGILIKLMNTQKYSSIPPLIENGEILNDAKKKADVLNEHFATKSTVNDPNSEVPNLDPIPVNYKVSRIYTSPIEVARLIRITKQSNISHCGISGKFLNIIATPISFSLSRLLNNHFEEGLYPDMWKISHITPIYKRKGLKSDKANYRPISLLPTLSKVFEAIIHQRLLSHCEENDIITERQAAYLKGDSTVNQLLTLVHKIKESWTKGNITQNVFMDIQGAFDKVWHLGLIAKLSQIGIEGETLKLLTSYLANRQQIVVIDGIKSKVQPVAAGVPQGSRLGPLLFLIYINDIVGNLESDIFIFADDTTLSVCAKAPQLATQILNRDMVKIADWANKWKVIFNPDKSKDIVFSRKDQHISPPTLYNNNTIERVQSHKHLGVYLTSNLDWKLQVNSVCLRANQKLGVLRKVRLLQRHTLDVLYKLTVRSVFDYALPVYYQSLHLADKERMESIQYNAAKLTTGALKYTSKAKLNQELGWETISDRAEYLGLTLFHKIHKNHCRPLVGKNLQPFDINKQHHRSNGGYVPFPQKSVNFSNSYFPYFTRKWNMLKKDTKILNLEDFKSHTKLNLKPPKFKHFQRGYKLSCTLLTRIRVGQSDLNTHRFKVGQTDSTTCMCLHPHETPEHYITQCFLYTEERRTLFSQIEKFIPRFKLCSMKRQFEILTQGYEINNPELVKINTQIMKFTQNFILKTKRFS
jgi:hypothetical protein